MLRRFRCVQIFLKQKHMLCEIKYLVIKIVFVIVPVQVSGSILLDINSNSLRSSS